MPRDPVCGNVVDSNTPFKEDLEGQTYYFCSEDCQEEFDVNTEDFTQEMAGGIESQD